MENYQKRVITEKEELDKKIERLREFYFSPRFNEIPPMQQTLLKAQLGTMVAYSEVLGARISLWNEPKP